MYLETYLFITISKIIIMIFQILVFMYDKSQLNYYNDIPNIGIHV